MKTAEVHSRCECQAPLGAELDERQTVLRGWASDPVSRTRERAPSHAIHPEQGVFQVAWLCPFCTRNVLRSFESTGLVWREAAARAAGAR
jgi:hypothetical protein